MIPTGDYRRGIMQVWYNSRRRFDEMATCAQRNAQL